MTTRNLVPRASNEGKLGTSTKKWADVFATNGSFSTLKISSLKLDSEIDLDLFVSGSGIETITTNNDGQFVIALDNSFLDYLGFEADGTKLDFTVAQNSVISADDNLVSAIQKLDVAVRDIAAPSNLTVASFDNSIIITSIEEFVDNDTTLMTSAAIDDRILSYGFTTNIGDITSVTAGTGLSGGGISGDITISLPDTGIAAGSYGSATEIPTFTVDQQGRLTTAGTASISTSFNIADNQQDPVIDIVNGGETLTFNGSDSISTVVSDNSVSFDLKNTTVVAGSYGSATEIPTFTVDSKGRLTAAGTASISTTLTIDSDGGLTQDLSLSTDDLQILGGQGLTSSITKVGTDVLVSIDLDNTAVTVGSYGSASDSISFTVDQQGRLTATSSTPISITSSQVNDATNSNTSDKIVKRDANGDFSAGTITATLSGNATSSTTAERLQTSRTITLDGDLTGNVSFDGSQDITLNAIIAANSIELGSDTTGNYVASISAGNGISLTDAGGGESKNHTISVSGILEDFVTLGVVTGADKFIVSTADGVFQYKSADDLKDILNIQTTDSVEFVNLDLTGSLNLKNNNELKLYEDIASGENYVSLKSPQVLNDTYTLVLPNSNGNLNEVLITDGNGNLSWTTVEAAAGNAVNSFATISVLGQNDLIADVAQDTLTFVAGDAIQITTNSVTDTLTINVSGLSNSQIAENAAIEDTKLSTISTANKVNITALDIDGATDIGADLSDSDLIIVDDGANGTNRKSSLSRLTTFVESKIDSLENLTSIGKINQQTDFKGSVLIDQSLTVSGNLTVNGEQFIVDGTTIKLDDNLIELGLVGGNAPTIETTKDLGLVFHRHDGTSASKLALFFDESDDKFKLLSGVTENDGILSGGTIQTLEANLLGDVTGTVSSIANHSTTNLPEGTNQYFTQERARDAISVSGSLAYDDSTGIISFTEKTDNQIKALISVTDAGGDGSLSYDNGSGVITYTGPSAAEARAHFSAGTGVSLVDGQISIGQSVATNANVQFNSVTADVIGTISSIANHSTTNLPEGTNQYFTQARARAAISVTDAGGDGSLSYNNESGVITYTGPSAAEARAHFSAGTGVTLVDGQISVNSDVVLLNQVQELTNKTIDADSNTITNISTSNLKAGVLDTDLTEASTNDDTLASAKAIKAYVDGQLGRFGGIFLTDEVNESGVYDVIYDASPLVRSHFGPFAFDLQQLRDSAFGGDEGSDIIFYGATATGASDRHFLVIGTGAQKGDCLFTGADATTP